MKKTISMKTLKLFVCTILALSILSPLKAAGDKKTAYLSPKEAGPDFLIQGEYVGKIGEKLNLGAQVIARGKGQFEAVLFMGGLPGAGWEGKVKVPLKGKTVEGQTELSGINFKGKIQDGTFSGIAEEDIPFSMKKVQRKSPTLGASPPDGAFVLFDGQNVNSWQDGKLEEGQLLGVGSRTKQKFKNFTLHLEFRLPFMPDYTGQSRGNSGMYLVDQYECQVLDSFGLNGENNECGGFYKIAKPAVNMCLPPLSWQTYDVEFQAAQFNKEGKKTVPAIVSIRHNGVYIHKKFRLPHITPGGGQADEKAGSLFLQDHGDPVRYRNIWILEKK